MGIVPRLIGTQGGCFVQNALRLFSHAVQSIVSGKAMLEHRERDGLFEMQHQGKGLILAEAC